MDYNPLWDAYRSLSVSRGVRGNDTSQSCSLTSTRSIYSARQCSVTIPVSSNSSAQTPVLQRFPIPTAGTPSSIAVHPNGTVITRRARFRRNCPPPPPLRGDPNLSPGLWRLPALYFATGHSNNVAVARVLLEAGVVPDVKESVCHSLHEMYTDCRRSTCCNTVLTERSIVFSAVPLMVAASAGYPDQIKPVEMASFGDGALSDIPVLLCPTLKTSLHGALHAGASPLK